MKSAYLFLFLAFVVFILPLKSFAQFGIGCHATSLSWFETRSYTEEGGSTVIQNATEGTGFGIEGYYRLSNKIRINLTLGYIASSEQRSVKDIYKTPVILISGYREPNELDIYYVSNPALEVGTDIQYAFFGDFAQSAFTIYGLGGVSANTYYYKTNYQVENTSNYTLSPLSPDQKRTYFGESVNLGIGFELALKKGFRIFLETKGCAGQKTIINSSNLNNFDLLPNNFNPGYAIATLGLRKNIK